MNVFCYLPYIANRSRWDHFLVVKLNHNLLENIRSWMVVLYNDKAYCIGYFTGKILRYQSIRETFHLKRFAIYGICYKVCRVW